MENNVPEPKFKQLELIFKQLNWASIIISTLFLLTFFYYKNNNTRHFL